MDIGKSKGVEIKGTVFAHKNTETGWLASVEISFQSKSLRLFTLETELPVSEF